jgi:hypothetical protein
VKWKVNPPFWPPIPKKILRVKIKVSYSTTKKKSNDWTGFWKAKKINKTDQYLGISGNHENFNVCLLSYRSILVQTKQMKYTRYQFNVNRIKRMVNINWYKNKTIGTVYVQNIKLYSSSKFWYRFQLITSRITMTEVWKTYQGPHPYWFHIQQQNHDESPMWIHQFQKRKLQKKNQIARVSIVSLFQSYILIHPP